VCVCVFVNVCVYICIYRVCVYAITQTKKQTPWPESVSELYRPSDRSMSAKLISTFVDRGFHVVSVTDPLRPYSRFSRSEPFFFQVAPQLYSRG
jgi:hypothetical protein